ncbi:unnamed protein product [Chrysoparadoxa australica]
MTAHLADNWDELFDVVNEKNEVVVSQVVGQANRYDCHKKGLRHRSVHILVISVTVRRTSKLTGPSFSGTTGSGELLLQRRSSQKSLAPNCWDLSCAEHLSAGEGYGEAALRGLQEELGITAHRDEIRVIRDVYQHKMVYPEVGHVDDEFTETYIMRYDGPIAPDPKEVAETEFWSTSRVTSEMASSPESFACWFRSEALPTA